MRVARLLVVLLGSAMVLAILLAIVPPPPPAAADPAGPTDYRSEVLAVDPPVPGLGVGFVGGDSFVELTAPPGREVVVAGYDGEPYLWFRADGAVLENQRSPATFLNDDRFAAVPLPASVDPAAAPAWEQVATGGRYAWHDHRTHWMGPQPPSGAEPGARILEAALPLTVDDEPVEVAVASYWLGGASSGDRVAAATGALAAAAAVGAASVWAGGRPALALLAGVGALALGVVAHRSIPPETGPSPALWAVPALAVLAAAAALALGRRRTPGSVRRPLLAEALVAVAGLELALWAWLRREALLRAVIPTDAPEALDRAAIAAVLVAGCGLAAVAVWRLVTGRAAAA